MHSGVEQDAMLVHLDEPGAGADVRVGIKIRDFHAARRNKTAWAPGRNDNYGQAELKIA
jgi:ABC-type Na+ transport system ATPase subunit NatA